MLLNTTQIDELLLALANLSGLDDELVEGCGPLIRSGQNDDAVARAFVVLEERLRKALKVRGGTGVNLSQKAFAADTGQLVAGLGLPQGETEGIRDLFVGVFRAYRNRAAHTHVGYDTDEALRVIHVADLLLHVLGQIGKVPSHPVMREVAAALGPRAMKRFEQFLTELEELGVREGKGKSWIPYWAMLRYQREADGEVKPHRVTLFYVAVRGGDPMLAFNRKKMSRIAGLDLKTVEGELLDAACTLFPLAETPVRLVLSDHNDTAALNRIRDVLSYVVQEHAA